jgi:uncharacterized membrane protein
MRKWFEIIAIGIFVLHFVYTLIIFQTLPDTIPTHFNFSGEADDFGSKASIWGTWLVSLGLFAMFSLLSYLPIKLWNLPEAAKQDATGQGKSLALELMSSLKAFTALLCLALTWLVVRSTNGYSVALFMTVLLGLTIVPLVIVGIYISKMSQLKN